jgi:hypothetical protein
MDNSYISAHEYEKNVNPQLTSIPFYERNVLFERIYYLIRETLLGHKKIS